MFRLLGKLFQNMSVDVENAQILAETFQLSFRRASTNAEQREAVYKYLQAHYENTNHPKVPDFPLKCEWINSTQPLSIHRDLKGKIVLLDFFTYCCINCMHILPELKALENKYSVEEGLVVIGVHCAKFTNEKQLKNVTSAVKRYDIGHAVVNDCKGAIWNSFQVHCWPTLVVIGPESEYLFSLQGEGHLKLLDCFIQNALALMKDKNLIKSHSLPQISITDELKSHEVLSFPGKVTSFASPKGNLLAIGDTGHNRIIVTDDRGVIQHIIGKGTAGLKDGNFENSEFHSPQGVIFQTENILFVADTENHAVREINLKEKTVKTVSGTGKQGTDMSGGKLWCEQELSSPWDLCFGKNTDVLFIAMAGTHQIWALYLSDDENLFKKGKKGECKVIAGSGREENRNNCYPHAAAFAQPSGLSYCEERNSVFIADSESSSVRELNLETGKVTGVAGGNRNPSDLFAFGDNDGIGSEIRLQHPLGVVWHPSRKQLYVADSYNHKIKIVGLQNNSCSSMKFPSKLDEPGGLCTLKDDLIIADTNHHCIKVCDLGNLDVSVLSMTEPQQQNQKSNDHEKNVNISTNGGKIRVLAKLNKPETISFNEEAPAFWDIKLTDEETNSQLSKMRLKLSLNSDFTIDVPKYSGGSTIKILLNGSAYFCKGDICFPSDINLSVNVHYVEEEIEDKSCDFSYFINQ